jgi:hypothetical protein
MRPIWIAFWILTGCGPSVGAVAPWPHSAYVCESFSARGAACVAQFQSGIDGGCTFVYDGPDCTLWAGDEAVAGCYQTEDQ